MVLTGNVTAAVGAVMSFVKVSVVVAVRGADVLSEPTIASVGAPEEFVAQEKKFGVPPLL